MTESTETTTKTTTECPECGAELPMEDGVMVNEILNCEECGVELEVTNLDPFQVERAPEVEEDWGE